MTALEEIVQHEGYSSNRPRTLDCPICEKEMNKESDFNHHYFCTNNCFEITYIMMACDTPEGTYLSDYENTVFIFNSKFNRFNPKDSNVMERIRYEVNYWRTDYRYLAEILMR